MSLSTHVLDAVTGRPAAGVAVRFELQSPDGSWHSAVEARTDDDGRIKDLAGAIAGVGRLIFDTGAYLGPDAFYPEVVVTFRIASADEHLHVPLLLSNYSYSTYRGS
jgi:5-hydroxyisourate hydrolase